jgi:hypothetical protein
MRREGAHGTTIRSHRHTEASVPPPRHAPPQQPASAQGHPSLHTAGLRRRSHAHQTPPPPSSPVRPRTAQRRTARASGWSGRRQPVHSQPMHQPSSSAQPASAPVSQPQCTCRRMAASIRRAAQPAPRSSAQRIVGGVESHVACEGGSAHGAAVEREVREARAAAVSAHTRASISQSHLSRSHEGKRRLSHEGK